MELHADILIKDGKKQFAVIPYEVFVELQERLADADDLLELREAKRSEGEAPSTALKDVRQRLSEESE